MISSVSTEPRRVNAVMYSHVASRPNNCLAVSGGGTCGGGIRGNGVCADGTCCSQVSIFLHEASLHRCCFAYTNMASLVIYCLQWGWCGTTPEHCNSPPTPTPPTTTTTTTATTTAVTTTKNPVCPGATAQCGPTTSCPDGMCCSQWGVSSHYLIVIPQ